MVVGVSSFANIGDCTATPGGFARLTLSVLQWIRSVKVTRPGTETFSLEHSFILESCGWWWPMGL